MGFYNRVDGERMTRIASGEREEIAGAVTHAPGTSPAADREASPAAAGNRTGPDGARPSNGAGPAQTGGGAGPGGRAVGSAPSAVPPAKWLIPVIVLTIGNFMAVLDIT